MPDASDSLTNDGERPRAVTGRRAAAALCVVVLIAGAGGAGGVWASHQFSDVGNGNFFHESIGAIGSAGCASGFNDGTFRPNSNPTRGQFAYWTHNCGGRVAFDEGSSGVGTAATEVASASVTAGALDNPPIDTGGFVLINAHIETSTNGANTTCEIGVELLDENGQLLELQFLDPVGSQSFNDAAGGFSQVASIDGGETKTFRIRAAIFGAASNCPGSVATVGAAITALYVPFDGSGAGGGASGAAESLSEPEVEPERR